MPREPLIDFDNPGDLINSVVDSVIRPADSGVNAWIRDVAQGTLAGLVNGHRPTTSVPSLMRQQGPLREALMHEFAFRAYAEEYATRGLCLIAAIAPTIEEMEYFVTQTIDEARHAACFREHLVELGVPVSALAATQEHLAKDDRDSILQPWDKWGRALLEERKDYLAGVALTTILIEGVLAPAAALSEIKWRRFDPVASEIAQTANNDEMRHLAVCATIIRERLLSHPQEKYRLMDFIIEGLTRWSNVPITEMVIQREMLYQAGLAEHKTRLGDLEIVPGIRLAETTVEQRLEIATRWSRELQANRLTYMGLGELVRH
jgi:hypothetical protein